MPAKELTMEEFLEYSGSESGGGSVLKWKEDKEVDVLLHPKAPYYGVWSHSWYALVQDRETNADKIIFTRFNSYEDDSVLKRARFRGDGKKEDDAHRYPWHSEPVNYYGIRENPPVVCPFSLLVEWVREHIDGSVPADQQISWLDKIFDVDTASGDEHSQVIHAGGFTGMFGAKDLTKDELVALKKAGVRRDEAFKESGGARLQYVFCVVPYAKPSEGAVVCIEAEALGKKFKQHIKDLRDDKRDPREQPVVFRWKFDEDKDFSNKYSVAVRINDPITVEHREALAADYPKDKLDRIVTDSNLVLLRRSFEQFWCHKVKPPWDAIFAPAMERYKGKPCALAPEDQEGSDADDSSAGGDEAAAGSDAAAPADEDVQCDNPVCGKAMKLSDPACPHCGAVYAADGSFTLPAPKEAPKPRSRSAAAKKS